MWPWRIIWESQILRAACSDSGADALNISEFLRYYFENVSVVYHILVPQYPVLYGNLDS